MTIQLLTGILAQATQAVAGNPQVHESANSMMAGSPFNDYAASVALYVLMVGGLVAVLMIGGFLALNIGLLSKRAEDRIGGRTPSDVGILKHSVWPDLPDEKATLPAEADASFIKKLREKEEEAKPSVPGRAA